MGASEFNVVAGKGGGGSEKPPIGNHLAVLVGVFSMGTQEQDYQGEISRNLRAFFVWELIGCPIAGTKKNHVIGIDLTISLGDKAKLKKFIEARTGKAVPDGTIFQPSEELGQPCLLNVVNKNGYPKIDGGAALPKGMPRPMPGYTPTLTTLADFKADPACIPDWVPWLFGSPLADHIRACIELGGEKPTSKKRAATPVVDVVAAAQKSGDPLPW